MKFQLLLAFLFVSTLAIAQQTPDAAGVERACLNYIEGFYEGDSLKLKAVLTPSLYKKGFWKNKEGHYESAGLMSYTEAIGYARNVLEKEKFASPDAPKGVQIMDISYHIAAAKVTAWWGIDYILLSRVEDRWIIEQVLWEGPLLSGGANSAKVFQPGLVGTEANEYAITFIDRNLLAFTRARKIMFLQRVDGEWGTPTVAPFSEQWNNEYPSFDEKSQRLYFASTRPSPGEEEIKTHNDIWYVEKQGGDWSDPVHLGGNFSTAGIDSGGTESEGVVYFHSNREGEGLNAVDLYSLDNPAGEPQKINVSTGQVDGEPFLFANGKKMLFMSAGHQSVGHSDIFLAVKKDNEWQAPVPIDNEGLVNTEEWEYSPSLTPDGKFLFFTRLVGGQADIYWLRTDALAEEIIQLLKD